ncbi:LysE family transporter [Ignicoccus hospitalis]|uniref:LysE family transporter n=1 Tax=Ignicoccus hospitalis TaxID=160233 RepID=UPI001EE27C04|nr:LysE family transporter [Ignicoccus hospitalis]
MRDVILMTLLVTPSGAFSPGLLSASAVAAGAGSGVLGGIAVATGHVLFELPYVFLLTKTLGKVKNVLDKYNKVLALVVFAFALFFAKGLLESPDMPKVTVNDALMAGFVFTAFNAYFLLWWVTVGLPLVEAASLSTTTFVAMYLSHVWMDYVWLAALAALGGSVANFTLINYILAALLMLFAVDVVTKSFFGKGILP